MLANAQSVVASEKSPEAFRTISEVALELDMPQHVLRFWESRFAQVRPIKRAGGRRYYRPEDVDLLRGIRTLLYREGFTIKGAQKVMRDKGQRYVAELGRQAFAEKVAPVETFEEPRYARAALAIVERAHPARAEDEQELEPELETIAEEPMASSLAKEERAKLEVLLAELLQLKARLREARPPI
ncbi:MAG: MerR family transcriptional regulator [Alphaproteobacteria bacterium]|nr:MerR family transcriptional regulator [Alphaproteobacteria bacterium]